MSRGKEGDTAAAEARAASGAEATAGAPSTAEARAPAPDLRLLLPAAALFSGALAFLPALELRPNRVSAGAKAGLAAAAPAMTAALAAALGLVLVLALASAYAARVGASRAGRGRNGAARRSAERRRAGAALFFAAPLPALLLAGLGAGATSRLAGMAQGARASLGAGAWLGLAAALALPSALAPAFGAGAPKARRLAALTAAATAAILAAAGLLDDLSLAREFVARRASFGAEFPRHLAYALFPTLAAFVVAAPLGRAAARSRDWERPVFLVANAAQVIPTLALLGFLVAPLAALGRDVPFFRALGVRGVGWAPASLALFLYALLPVAANARAGFRMVDPAASDAANGMGMGAAGRFFRVELPLASPALVAGLRTALAQNMGNAVLAGLVGGGGLGGILFLGLSQAAADLILLAALGVAAAAYGTDRLLAAAERALARRTAAGAGAPC
ncbi:MAG: ABC transporter permease [Spirochaetaceae bacterium]|nr:ABC transporter permease [Spirochaetaceae bacterium]